MNLALATAVSDSFLSAYERCMNTTSVTEHSPQLLVPAVVCLAFSIEVGFKVILAREGCAMRLHPLFELYEKMKPETRQLLTYNTAMSQLHFDERLRKASTAFVDWRYIYENATTREVSIDFLLRLAYATKQITAE